jgi:sugar O-acyltransferase (sialic acid O-acetyltransferase NeuD family)
MKELSDLIKEKNISGGIVAIGDNAKRRELAQQLKKLNLKLINAIHPTAILDSDVSVGEGNYIAQGVIIVTGTKIGNCCNIHTAASIDHDNILEDGVNLGPGVRTAGRVTIKQDAFLGTGTVVIPDITIGEGSYLGGGSVVIKNIQSFTKEVGNPSRKIKNLSHE